MLGAGHTDTGVGVAVGTTTKVAADPAAAATKAGTKKAAAAKGVGGAKSGAGGKVDPRTQASTIPTRQPARSGSEHT